MKTFLQFITENTATQQATRLGLEGDGHGGWYKDGEFVAKTEKGQLKFYNKRQRPGQDPKQTDREHRLSHSTREPAAKVDPEKEAKDRAALPSQPVAQQQNVEPQQSTTPQETLAKQQQELQELNLEKKSSW